MIKDGIVTIHGKEYKTVALRVSEFREVYGIGQGWGITNRELDAPEGIVKVLSQIIDPEGRVVAEGLAEEDRSAGRINKTSALENCATSAIGRALAAAGYGGSEFASANEVEEAIHQQGQPAPKPTTPPTTTKETAQITKDNIISFSNITNRDEEWESPNRDDELVATVKENFKKIDDPVWHRQILANYLETKPEEGEKLGKAIETRLDDDKLLRLIELQKTKLNNKGDD